jgi:hypothetical protein
MIGFFLKKTFFDGWDNLFSLGAFNLVHLVILLIFIGLPLSFGTSDLLMFGSIAVGILALSLWQSVCVFSMTGISDYKTPSIKACLSDFSAAWKPGFAIGLINIVLCFSITVGIPFYLLQKSFLGLFFASLLFWTSLVVSLAAQYFLALAARRGGTISKNARAALSLFFDNPGFSLFMLVHSAVSLFISVFTAFLVPGLAGIALAQADAVKLRLKKYEWLESVPGADRKHVPWNELLEEEKDLVGVRTLKGMIFPWKDSR